MVLDWLDILTTILGLIYIWLEYRAHIALWVIGIVMPALDIILYANSAVSVLSYSGVAAIEIVMVASP